MWGTAAACQLGTVAWLTASRIICASWRVFTLKRIFYFYWVTVMCVWRGWGALRETHATLSMKAQRKTFQFGNATKPAGHSRKRSLKKNLENQMRAYGYVFLCLSPKKKKLFLYVYRIHIWTHTHTIESVVKKNVFKWRAKQHSCHYFSTYVLNPFISLLGERLCRRADNFI